LVSSKSNSSSRADDFLFQSFLVGAPFPIQPSKLSFFFFNGTSHSSETQTSLETLTFFL